MIGRLHTGTGEKINADRPSPAMPAEPPHMVKCDSDPVRIKVAAAIRSRNPHRSRRPFFADVGIKGQSVNKRSLWSFWI
jgi:hypothetical protein